MFPVDRPIAFEAGELYSRTLYLRILRSRLLVLFASEW